MSMRLLRIGSSIAVVASGALFVSLLILWDASVDRPRTVEFQRGAARWEIGCQAGVVWVGNGPQARIALLDAEAAVQRLERDRVVHRTPMQQKLAAASYDSSAYYDARKALEEIDAQYDAERVRLADARVEDISHEFGFSLLLIVIAIPPVLSLLLALARRRGLLRELLRPASALAVLCTLITVFVAGLSLRSFWMPIRYELQLKVPLTGVSLPGDWAEIYKPYAGRSISLVGGRLECDENQSVILHDAVSTPPFNFRGNGPLVISDVRLRARGFQLPEPQKLNLPGISYLARPIWTDSKSLVPGYRVLIISTWLPVGICAMLTIFFVRRRWLRYRMETRRRNNACAMCGYSLTANTSGVCPECGHPCVSATIVTTSEKQP